MADQQTATGSGPILYIDHSDVRRDALDELKRGVQRLVEFIEAREPRLLAYGFYIDDEAATMTVVALHPDSASLELHLNVGGAEFRKLAPLLTLTAIECYGEPSPAVLDQLQRKAAALGNGATIVTVRRVAGFERFRVPAE